MDAMPEGGTLIFRIGQEDSMIRVELSDTGTGIPLEIREKILQPFFTYGKKHGTGLGLAIARTIVEDHGASRSSRKPGREPPCGSFFRSGRQLERKASQSQTATDQRRLPVLGLGREILIFFLPVRIFPGAEGNRPESLAALKNGSGTWRNWQTR